MKADTRLSGDAAEYILASILRNKYEIITQRFNIEGFDLIAFATGNWNSLFKVGTSPFYIQVRTRGAGMTGFGKKGKTFTKISNMVELLGIQWDSVYLAVGFFKGKDIRKIKFYLIPWSKIGALLSKTGKSYRFRKNDLDRLAQNNEIQRI